MEREYNEQLKAQERLDARRACVPVDDEMTASQNKFNDSSGVSASPNSLSNTSNLPASQTDSHPLKSPNSNTAFWSSTQVSSSSVSQSSQSGAPSNVSALIDQFSELTGLASSKDKNEQIQSLLRALNYDIGHAISLFFNDGSGDLNAVIEKANLVSMSRPALVSSPKAHLTQSPPLMNGVTLLFEMKNGETLPFEFRQNDTFWSILPQLCAKSPELGNQSFRLEIIHPPEKCGIISLNDYDKSLNDLNLNSNTKIRII